MARKELDSNDVKIEGGDREFSIERGDAKLAFEHGDIDTDLVVKTDAIEFERFMHDMILVHIQEAPTENDPQYCEVTVNGDRRTIPRGSDARIPRKHVAVLAQAKGFRVAQEKVQNPDGSQSFREKVIASLAYPFQVLEDPNPKGRAWLKQLLANPV